MPQPSAQRRGLTILEVMISIGIASVGLLGALALLPLASTLAQIGLDEDTKSAVGRGAISHFKIMGGARKDMWVRPDGTAVFVGGVINPASLESFCIDPRYIAENGLTTATNFPAVATHSNPMDRITLRRPGSAIAPAPLTLMPLHLTREIFQTTDDLVFHPDEDKSLPPAQEYVLDSASAPIKRQSKGRMSWMAIVTPVLGRDSDMFNLAIVVFHSRDLDPNVLPGNERVSDVTFYGGGFTGGDVQLTGTSAAPNNINDVDVRRDDWVMLSQDTDTTNDPGGEINRWYRVIESDVDDTLATRHVTLLGPDWDDTTTIPTQATFLPGVVAVYERTIRLESTSLWSN